MPRKDPRVDAYIANAAPFAQPILTHLRKLVHTGCPETEETMKWGMPFFDYKGMLCHMAAFKQHCAFGFWKSDLLFGGARDGEEAAMGNFGRITSLADLPADKVLIGHVRKAAKLNDSGAKRPARKKSSAAKPPLPVPDYFATALRMNKSAQKAFDGFTPSQRNEYIEWLTEAKREETRESRLATALEWIAEAKARNWKHQRK